MANKQINYKPKKEKVSLIEPKPQLSGDQVLEYIGNKLWDNRAFILAAIIIIQNVFLLVRR